MNDLLRRLLFLPEQASTFAPDVDALHYFVIIVTMLGALGVGGTALGFLVRYGRRADARPARTPEVAVPGWLEAGFITLLTGLFLLWWVIGYRQYLRLEIPPEGSMDVYVTAQQWVWKFAYPQGPSSVGVLYVPAGRPVKLILTARDVIHSFYVPAFRIKQDAVPGRYTSTWFEAVRPGRYQVLCAEYCGTAHSEMRGDVVALSAADFEAWLGGAGGPAPVGLAARGERVAAEQGCLRCHTVDGAPHIGPTWLGLYGREETLSDGTRVKVDEAYITESMMDPAARLVAGYQPIMPSYLGLVSAPDTAAIVEYIRSLAAGPGRAGSPARAAPGGTE